MPYFVIGPIVQLCGVGSKKWVSGVGEPTNTLPFGKRCIRGYHPVDQLAWYAADQPKPTSYISTVLFLFSSSSRPPNTIVVPSASAAFEGYHRPLAMSSTR